MTAHHPYGTPNPTAVAEPAVLDGFAREFSLDLQAHMDLCEEVMALTARESETLAGSGDYVSFDFYHKRKDLLPRLDQSLIALRTWRQRWQQLSPAERAACAELKSKFQVVQGLLMKILMLDRENQQAMLRRGMLPARQLPSAAVQQPHCVIDAYRRHARR
jgi:hypothetical protein